MIYDNVNGCNSKEEIEEACASGIVNLNNGSEIIIYPIPATNQIHCQFKIPYSECMIRIYDMLGTIVDVVEVQTGQSEVGVDISAYMPGIYFVVLKDENGIIGRKKFVVR